MPRGKVLRATKTERLTVRLSQGLKRQLERLAEDHQRSLSNFFTAALTRLVEERGGADFTAGSRKVEAKAAPKAKVKTRSRRKSVDHEPASLTGCFLTPLDIPSREGGDPSFVSGVAPRGPSVNSVAVMVLILLRSQLRVLG